MSFAVFIVCSTKLAYYKQRMFLKLGHKATALRHTVAIPICQGRRMQANIQFVRIVLAWRKNFLTIISEYHESYYA